MLVPCLRFEAIFSEANRPMLESPKSRSASVAGRSPVWLLVVGSEATQIKASNIKLQMVEITDWK